VRTELFLSTPNVGNVIVESLFAVAGVGSILLSGLFYSRYMRTEEERERLNRNFAFATATSGCYLVGEWTLPLVGYEGVLRTSEVFPLLGTVVGVSFLLALARERVNR
jgi:hypothetical protein